jgi:hypothetical protein
VNEALSHQDQQMVLTRPGTNQQDIPFPRLAGCNPRNAPAEGQAQATLSHLAAEAVAVRHFVQGKICGERNEAYAVKTVLTRSSLRPKSGANQ